MDINFSFGHGLGDNIFFAPLAGLYKLYGHNVIVNVHNENFKDIWLSCGVNLTNKSCKDFGMREPYTTKPSLDQHSCSTNKLGCGMKIIPGYHATKMWNDYLNLIPSLDDFIKTKDEIEKFINTIPKPLVILHPKGSTTSYRKDLDSAFVDNLIYKILLESNFSIFLLDEKNYCNSRIINNGRFRHSSSFRNMTIAELWYIIKLSDLYIGVDSGPFHLARWCNIPRIGLWYKHHPSWYCIPSENTLNISAGMEDWTKARRHEFNIIHTDKLKCDEIIKYMKLMYEQKFGWKVMINELMNLSCHNIGQKIYDRNQCWNFVMDRIPDKCNIVEIGSSNGNWSFGNFSYIMSILLRWKNKGNIHSVDINPNEFIINLQKQFDFLNVYKDYGYNWIKQYDKEIDLIYLDSHELTTPNAMHLTYRDAMIAKDKAKMILFDDTWYDGYKFHGIGSKSCDELTKIGFKLIWSGSQVLLSR